jgi:hypothetical protein
MENSKDPIGFGTRLSPGGIAVSQPTLPHSAPSTTDIITNKLCQSGNCLLSALFCVVQRATNKYHMPYISRKFMGEE